MAVRFVGIVVFMTGTTAVLLSAIAAIASATADGPLDISALVYKTNKNNKIDKIIMNMIGIQ